MVQRGGGQLIMRSPSGAWPQSNPNGGLEIANLDWHEPPKKMPRSERDPRFRAIRGISVAASLRRADPHQPPVRDQVFGRHAGV
jgi:hypothetical protein